MKIYLIDLKNSKIVTYFNVNISSSEEFVSKILQVICQFLYVKTHLLNSKSNGGGYAASLKFVITIYDKKSSFTSFEYNNDIVSFPINVVKHIYSKINNNVVIIEIKPVLPPRRSYKFL
uniref:Uncharacterized protein n=1 Tax=Chrysoporthe austroafricana TaxID=354353 RepID=A0A191MWT0_9PEZI|nr:hypothetical protein [Chrysoporthe austroafricana]AMX22125.1 hypothetical protein [Chrysoporthe austroafricana]